MKGTFLLNIVVTQRSAIFQLFSCEYQALLVGWYAFLILNLCLDIFDSVVRLNLKGNGLASQSLHKYLHFHIQEIIFRPFISDPVPGRYRDIFSPVKQKEHVR